MGKSEREKGKAGERELAELFRAHGIGARRGVQSGGAGSRQAREGSLDGRPDVVQDLDWLHVEVKRVNSFALRPALAQAQADARPGEVPSVWQRGDRQDWVVVLRGVDFLDLVKRGLLG